MAVVCVGRCWLLDELGERRCFETALTSAGFRHEEFTLQVNPVHEPDSKRRYDVKVTHMPTRSVKAYRGGQEEDWITAFADDLAGGLYGRPDDRHERDARDPRSMQSMPMARGSAARSREAMSLEELDDPA
jgi:hypothetical protein